MSKFSKDFATEVSTRKALGSIAFVGKISIALTFLILFAFIYLMNILTPTWGDDWLQSNITGLHIFSSAYQAYLHWSGRIAVYVLEYTFFGYQPASLILFDLLNSLIFCGLIWASFTLGNGRSPALARDVIDLSLIFCMIWTLTQSVGEAALWKSGAIDYLWPIAGSLFLLMPYLALAYQGKISTFSQPWIWVIAIAAWFLGTGLEHVSAVVTGALLFLLFEAWRARRVIPRWMIVTACAHTLGTCMLILAPGNFARAKALSSAGLRPINERLPDMMDIIYNLAFAGRLGWVLLFFFVLATLNRFQGSTDLLEAVHKRFLLCFSLFFLSAFILLPSPAAPVNRVAFPVEIFLITAIATLMQLRPRILMLDLLLIVIGFSAAGSAMRTSLKDERSIAEQVAFREQLIANVKAYGGTVATIPEIWSKRLNIYLHEYTTKYLFARDIAPEEDPGSYNAIYAQIHGLTHIKAVESYVQSLPLLLNLLKEHKLSLSGEHFTAITYNRDLYYILPGDSCKPAQIKHPFFVHIVPIDRKNLTASRRQAGYDNLDFIYTPSNQVLALNTHGEGERSVCLLYTRLPDYAWKEIDTGQYDPVSSKVDWQQVISP